VADALTTTSTSWPSSTDCKEDYLITA